ncbi:MAG: hypothetical protein CL775_01105 [Chloroflexi bacterium]|nr:hypothetical protein [Chloroflexota bacterium]|tara:strand:+ start:197 stop:565 length:369 start_codon:yes stop_codon:yes gene_type:complete
MEDYRKILGVSLGIIIIVIFLLNFDVLSLFKTQPKTITCEFGAKIFVEEEIIVRANYTKAIVSKITDIEELERSNSNLKCKGQAWLESLDNKGWGNYTPVSWGIKKESDKWKLSSFDFDFKQ